MEYEKEEIAKSRTTIPNSLINKLYFVSIFLFAGIFPVKPPFHVNVEFKRPIFLPSTSVFTFIAQANKDSYRFKVEDKETRVPQLTGYIQRS